MKKYFLFLLFLMIASLGFCQPAGALKGYYPASGTYHLLTVATPSADIPAWPFNYPTGTALGYYPASSTYHPLIVDELGRLAVDAGAQGYWEKINDNVVPVGSAPVVIDDLKVNPATDDYSLILKLGYENTGIGVGPQGRIRMYQGATKYLEFGPSIIIAFKDLQTTSELLTGYGTPTYPSHTFGGDSNTGLSRAAEDTLAFSTGGVEAARFTDGQRLLLGTTEDDGVNTLQVNGNTKIDGNVIIGTAGDTGEKLQVNGNIKVDIDSGIFKTQQINLANGASIDVRSTLGLSNYPFGMLEIICLESNFAHGAFSLIGTNDTSSLLYGSTTYLATSDTASKLCVYSSGSGDYSIKNNLGGSRAILLIWKGLQ